MMMIIITITTAAAAAIVIDNNNNKKAKIIGKFSSSKEEFLNGCTLRLECIMVNFRFRG